MTSTETQPAAVRGAAPASVVFVIAAACGLVVANIYYVQPLVGLLSRDYGMAPASAGLLVTATQIGYAAGLLFVVPLGDIVENRRLIGTILVGLVLALAAAVFATSAATFLVASLLIGLTSSVVQIMVPFAGHLAPAETRGRVVGTVVSGLLLGIMLSRPASSFMAHAFGPRSVFLVSDIVIVVLTLVLVLRLPDRRPHGMPYARALASLPTLFARNPVLRRRSLFQATLFGCFSVFWTACPLLLEGPQFGLSQLGIGLFALVGAGGAFVSPFAGRLADAGHGEAVTLTALVGAIAAFAIAWAGAHTSSLTLLVIAGLVLDMATAAHLVTGQRDVFSLEPEARGRLNGLYLALFFAGGALGSLLAGIAYAHGAWPATCLIGGAFPLVGLVYLFSEPRRSRPARATERPHE